MATTDVAQLLVRVNASTELLRRNMADAERAVAGFQRDTDRRLGQMDSRFAQLGQGLTKFQGRLSGFTAALVPATIIATLATAGVKFIQIAEQAKQMRAQITLATATFGDFGTAQADVRRIADETRGSLDATTKLYTNFLRASEPLGRSQAEAARATETFAKALKIGGAGAAEAESATLQFGQALASGVLRGDEFNSIAEASPRILKLIADSLGVTSGALRAMAADGKLSADALYTALTDRKFTAGIDAEFGKLPVTFGDAMQQVTNAAAVTFGAFDEGGGFSTALAGFVSRGGQGFVELESGARELGLEIRSTFEGLGDAFGPMLAGALDAFGGIRGGLVGVKGDIADILETIDTLRNFPADLANYAGEKLHLPSFIVGTSPGTRSKLASNFLTGAARYEQDARRDALLGEFSRGLPGYLRSLQPPKPRAAPPSTAGGGKKRAGPKPKVETADERARRITAGIAEEFGPAFVSNELQYAGLDTSALDKINAQIGELRTGLEGVDIGSILTEEEQRRLEGVDIGSILTEEEQRRLEGFIGDFQRDLTNGLAGALAYGESLGDVLVNSLKRAGAALLSSGLTDLLSGKKFGSSFGPDGIKSVLGGLFGGFREGGGDVSPGRAYVVGEKRPELFVPKVPGVIVPRIGRMAGGASEPQRITVDVQPSPLFVTSVAMGGRAAGEAGARSAIGAATRPRLARSAGAP